MRKILILQLILASVFYTSYASATPEARINTIKNLYADAYQQILNNGEYNDANVLFKYANRDLRYAISLYQNDSGTYEDGSLTECNTSGELLHLVNGNGWDLGDATDISFQLIRNNEVRVLTFFESGNDIKDYSLQCIDNSCEITDTFDNYGVSALHQLMQDCE